MISSGKRGGSNDAVKHRIVAKEFTVRQNGSESVFLSWNHIMEKEPEEQTYCAAGITIGATLWQFELKASMLPPGLPPVLVVFTQSSINTGLIHCALYAQG